jgi:hypothetical protein
VHDPAPLTFIAASCVILVVIYYMGTSKFWISVWTSVMGVLLVYEGVGMAIGLMERLH